MVERIVLTDVDRSAEPLPVYLVASSRTRLRVVVCGTVVEADLHWKAERRRFEGEIGARRFVYDPLAAAARKAG